ncbi:MAG: DUF2971 domain-containing protein [Lachnospiraceae bacterium]|nr:DUF2971 domain-containing protein [Lachnospiraceae bacterium]
MKSVYHYCSVDTFLKIIQNKTIRLTDIGKSNDYEERIYIENKIHEELLSQLKNELSIEEFRNVLQVEELCRNMLRENIILYAMCFSEQKDLLSQWRGYANNGTGIAIGFSKEILDSVNKETYGLTFKPICYKEEQQKIFVMEQVKTIINTMQIKNAFAAFAEVYENEIANLGCMKASGFSEEKEWRLCKAMSPELRIDCEAEFPNFTLSRVHEQCTREQIVTYFDLSYETVLDNFITEIVIGPNAKVTSRDIYRSLYINGYNPDKIEIAISNITYRQ